MSAGGLGTRRTSGERVLAWLLTGPLGHLYAFVADVLVLWTRWAVVGSRRRLARARAPAGLHPSTHDGGPG